MDKESITYHKQQVERFKKAVEEPLISKEGIFTFIGIFLAVFTILFVFKLGKTLLFEVSPNNSKYVTYEECVESETDYGPTEKTVCLGYRTRTVLLTTRIRNHIKFSLLAPSLLSLIGGLFIYSERKNNQRRLNQHQSALIELYEKKNRPAHK